MAPKVSAAADEGELVEVALDQQKVEMVVGLQEESVEVAELREIVVLGNVRIVQ